MGATALITNELDGLASSSSAAHRESGDMSVARRANANLLIGCLLRRCSVDWAIDMRRSLLVVSFVAASLLDCRRHASAPSAPKHWRWENPSPTAGFRNCAFVRNQPKIVTGTKYDKNNDGKLDFAEFAEYATGKPWTGPVPQAVTSSTKTETKTETTTSAKPAPGPGQNAAALLAFQSEFHRGFLEGYSQGYNQGLQKFVSSGKGPAPAQTQGGAVKAQ